MTDAIAVAPPHFIGGSITAPPISIHLPTVSFLSYIMPDDAMPLPCPPIGMPTFACIARGGACLLVRVTAAPPCAYFRGFQHAWRAVGTTSSARLFIDSCRAHRATTARGSAQPRARRLLRRLQPMALKAIVSGRVIAFDAGSSRRPPASDFASRLSFLVCDAALLIEVSHFDFD